MAPGRRRRGPSETCSLQHPDCRCALSACICHVYHMHMRTLLCAPCSSVRVGASAGVQGIAHPNAAWRIRESYRQAGMQTSQANPFSIEKARNKGAVCMQAHLGSEVQRADGLSQEVGRLRASALSMSRDHKVSCTP